MALSPFTASRSRHLSPNSNPTAHPTCASFRNPHRSPTPCSNPDLTRNSNHASSRNPNPIPNSSLPNPSPNPNVPLSCPRLNCNPTQNSNLFGKRQEVATRKRREYEAHSHSLLTFTLNLALTLTQISAAAPISQS